ncbi:MAG: ligand-binding sensor domain-containing protein [Bacteroidia bacterium]
MRIYIVLMLQLLLLPAFSQQYNFHNYSVKDGVAQSQVYSLLQDSRGYLWMGTQGGGMTSFDGRNFKTYSVKEGLPSTKVFSMREDKHTNLWIGTMNGLSYYNGIRFRNFLAGKAVREIDLDAKGNLWLATDKGIFYQKTDTDFINVSLILKDREPNIKTLMVDKSGDVWVGSDGLYRISVKNGIYDELKFTKANGFTNNTITSIKQDAAGWIWIGTYGDGAYVYDSRKFFRIDLQQELYKQTVLDFYFDDRNNVWMGTLTNGVLQYNRDTKSFGHLTTNEGLSNNHVHCITQDKSGNYWFGTSGNGVCNYFGKQFTQYDKSSGLSENYIYTMFRDSKERLWISSYDKGVDVYDSSRFRHFGAPEGFDNVKVRAIGEDNAGNIYLGTDGQGVFVYDGTAFKPIGSLDRKFIRAIAKDKDGNLWLASATGIYKLTMGESAIVIKNFTMKEGLLRDRIACLHNDKEGRLWYGTESGAIGLIVNDQPKDPKIELKGLTYNSIWCFAEDAGGQLWIGTDGGIAAFPLYQNNHRLTVYNHTIGLTSSNVYLLTFDRENNLFVGTETGLDYMEFDRERKITGIKHYGKGEGFTGVETCKNAVFNDKDGTIWFGTINGLSKYNPKNKVKNAVAPVTSISDVTLFNMPISQTEFKQAVGDWNAITKLVLPYDQNNIGIYFTGINFPNPDAVKYQWKLEGSGNDWSPPVSQNNVNFSNLGPGDYVFKVKACNEDGVWNKEPVTLKFSIRPPFWRSWWFITIIIATLASIIIAFFRWRVNRIRAKAAEDRKKLQLEKEVVELEQKALRLQMNPHFIFNALNSIQSQIGTDNEQAARYYLAKFSRLMRQILDNSRNTEITIEEEVGTLENYLLIEKFCNGDRFDYTIRVDDAIEKDYVKIPPMLLQPFIENAIKHGLKNSSDKRGLIEVEFREKNNVLECSVTDNGIGRKKAEELNKGSKETYHKSTALIVTQERLDLLKENPAVKSLEIIDLHDENGEASGTKVVVRIPVG